MGKKGGSAPPAPDAYETASTEAQFNRLDTYGPAGGGVRHGYTDANGNFVAGVAPQGRQSAVSTVESDIDRQLRLMLEPAALDLTGRVISDNITGMPDAARVKDRSDVAADIFNRNFSLMSPALERSQNRLLTNLQARGLPVGSEAFNEAYGNQQRETGETLSRLAMDANVAAGQEQSRQFGLDAAARSNAIAELVAAMGGGYNPPGNVPSGAAPSVNYSGLVGRQYDNEMAQYNAQQQQRASTAGALGSLGGALLMKCTRAAKDVSGGLNPVWAAEVLSNLPLHIWTYKPGEAPQGDHGRAHIGPMAEDFHGLTTLGDGRTIDAVDIIGLLAGALQFSLAQITELRANQVALMRRIAAIEAEGEVSSVRMRGRIN